MLSLIIVDLDCVGLWEITFLKTIVGFMKVILYKYLNKELSGGWYPIINTLLYSITVLIGIVSLSSDNPFVVKPTWPLSVGIEQKFYVSHLEF